MNFSLRPLFEGRNLSRFWLQQVMGQVDVFSLSQQRVNGFNLLVEARHQSPGIRTYGLIFLHLSLAEGAAKRTCDITNS